MHQQEAQCQARRAMMPTAPAASGTPDADADADSRVVLPAERAHLSGDGPVALSGTARARPFVPVPAAHQNRISTGLPLGIGLRLSSLLLVLVLLALVLPGCGPPT